MIWVTRARPKVDRIACPWLIRRYLDPDAEFRFVAGHRVLEVAAAVGGHAFDAPGAAYSHRTTPSGELCTFETLIEEFDLGADRALAALARIVHAGDIRSDVDSHPFGAAIRAIGDAGGFVEPDDHRLLERALFIYDSLYAYCQELTARTVAFVCEHGAGRSRVAAALFAASRPAGWNATTAGLTPQATVSIHASALLAGEAAGDLVDLSPPRPASAAPADLIIAIDCDVPGATRWDVAARWPSERAREELRGLVSRLISDLGRHRA